MRDRTAARNYSPERDEFRREHERHRAWGLIQRHGERRRRLRDSTGASQAASVHEHRTRDQAQQPPATPAPVPLEQQQRQALRNAPTDREPARRRGTDAAAPAQEGQPAPARQGDVRDDAAPSRRPMSAPRRGAPARSPLGPLSPASGLDAAALRAKPQSIDHRSAEAIPSHAECEQEIPEADRKRRAPTIRSRPTLVRTRSPPLVSRRRRSEWPRAHSFIRWRLASCFRCDRPTRPRGCPARG